MPSIARCSSARRTRWPAEIDRYVQKRVVDGLILGSHVSPAGLDEVVDRVVSLLRERGVLRTEYAPGALRDNLGLRRSAERQEARRA